ncbi:hypothetical protein [Hungatella hathewayi]|uniref:hypothetical protein n=1 Tax=Hungatella hathewayi TaxID=154046 RepID=UPI0022E3D207|nr:hypothetical protein [Hungatella hathewayi]
MKKAKLLIATLAMSAVMATTALAGEWKQDQAGWWYQNDDGNYQTNQWFQDFDGTWYYLNESGYMLTNGTAPDGRQVGADGKWIEPITGETMSILKDAHNWLITDIWSKGYCDFSWYQYNGKDSTGSDIDIDYAYQIFKDNYKKLASYNLFINSLPSEYDSIKTAWNKCIVESNNLYHYYEEKGIVLGNDVNSDLFQQYMNAFSKYTREAAKKNKQ